MSELVNAKQLAARLKVSPATIHAWHRWGWIPCLRAGRRPVLFDVEAVEDALRKRGQSPATRSELLQEIHSNLVNVLASQELRSVSRRQLQESIEFLMRLAAEPNQRDAPRPFILGFARAALAFIVELFVKK